MPLKPGEYESSKVPMVDEDNLAPHRRLKYGEVDLTLGHQIARGGYSTVYGGRDVFGNELAVKVYNEKAVQGMWENEVANYLRLRHPQITHLYGAFQLEGESYIVLEHAGLALGRVTLGDQRERRLVTMLAAKGMCEALHFMHVQGFVHTDINPGNVLLRLSPDNTPQTVKLCDLGLTRRREDLRPGKHRAKWNPSPECVDPDRFGRESRRMDVYSAALVLMELLRGEELGRFTDDEICEGAPREMAASLNEPIGDVLARALVPRVADRLSALDLWTGIRKVGFDR